MIKNINPRKLLKKRIHKLSYPGKTAEEICSEINTGLPKVDTNPSHIIIHAGTNNLVTTDSANTCASKIKHLATKAQQIFPQAQVAISSLTIREDVDVSAKLDNVNSQLSSACNEHGFGFIDNNLIDNSCLNGSKLHLNAKGSALLAVQFIKFLRSSKANSGTSTKWNKRQGFQQVSTLRQLGQFLMNLGTAQPRSR